MAIDYSQYIYKLPGTNTYYSSINGTDRMITSTPQEVESLLGGKNVQEKGWGVNTIGYDPQHGGGTTGGAMDLSTFKSNVYGMMTPEQRGETGTVTTTPQINADFRARGADETMSDYLVAKQAAGVGGVNFGTANNQPITSTNVSLLGTLNTNRSLISSTPQAGYIKAYDTDQNYKEVYVPKGIYVPGISATPKQTTVGSYNQASPVNVPSGTPTGGTSSTTNADSSALIADYNARMAAENAMKTPEQKQADELTGQISTLIGQEAGKSAYTEGQLQAQVDPLIAQLTGIKNKIEALKVEQEKARLDSEGQPMTLARLYGENARQNALYNNQIDNLTAQGNALLGNIELAKTQVERAVNAKYGVIEESIALKQAQLAAIQPILTKQEKIQADVVSKQYEAQKQAIEDKKTEEKGIQNLVLSYIKDMADNKKAPNQNVIAQLQGAKDINSALAVYSKNTPIKSSGGSASQKIYGATNIPLNLKSELIQNISNGADRNSVYLTYPEVSSEYINNLFDNVEQTGQSVQGYNIDGTPVSNVKSTLTPSMLKEPVSAKTWYKPWTWNN
jgi:hypothetical protein